MRTPPYVRILSFALVMVGIIACGETPTSPTLVAQGPITATPHAQQATLRAEAIEDGPPHDLAFIVEEEMHPGQVAYLCSTQPRLYGHPDGTVTSETDYYASLSRCPATRVP